MEILSKHVISGLDDLVKKNLRLSGQRIDMKALAEKVAENTMFLLENFGQEVEEEQSCKPGAQCHGLVLENSVIPVLMLRGILVLPTLV